MTTTREKLSALEDFHHARRKAFWRDLYSRLTRRCNRLVVFDQIRQCLAINGQRHRGLQAVRLDKIVGSEGRYR